MELSCPQVAHLDHPATNRNTLLSDNDWVDAELPELEEWVEQPLAQVRIEQPLAQRLAPSANERQAMGIQQQ